ncbi:dynactin, partial [Cristinia sonorae]
MAPGEITLGALVEVSVGKGIVRFYGSTAFSAVGKWVGIELFEPKGKNDGTVQEVKYFTCKPGHGIFVKPSQVKVISSEAEPVLAPAPAISRPLGHQRTSSTSRGPSARASPAVPASPRAASPAKPSGSSGSPLIAPSPTRPPYRLGSPTKRTPSLTIHPKAGVARTPTLQVEALGGLLSRQQSFDSPLQENSPRSFPNVSPRPGNLTPAGSYNAASSIASASSSSAQTVLRRRPTTPPPPPQTRIDESVAEEPPRVTTPIVGPYIPQIRAQPRVLDDQELQELRARIRVLEAKRGDDARRIRELETRLSEAESFVALRPKLQAKLSQLQTDLITTKRELADAQQLSQLAESRNLDNQEQLEMAMLDKEVAEERAELAESDLEELREKLAMLEVEIEVLREGGDAGGGTNESAVKESLAYIQLEKQNERLKEALIRLRDVTQENDQEQRRRIAGMEKDITTVDELQAQYESTLIKLTNAEVQIDDLKAQLDDALGAEEMLVQLTERNLMLGEKIEEMRITIEDLEALKELNDELEENHLETEKMMQDDLNNKDAEIFEQSQKIKSLEDSCQDLDGTIVQFRELVLSLQSELDNLRTESQTAQHESATAASQTAAMMTLNLKLQSSASKNQARNIDLEVKRIEAREARELLTIIQPYLPQVYVESDMDATNCYLFFQRLSLKVDLINNFVGQVHNLPECLNGPVTDLLVGVCEMRGRLSSLSIACKRFAAVLRRCDVETFLNIGRLYAEIAPVEKRIDMHIDLLRREEFREVECVSDAVKMQSQFDHLSETYFSGYDFDLAERELGYALSVDHDFEMFAASMGLIKTSVETVMKDEDVEFDLGDHDAEEEFFAPLRKLLDQCRSARVLSKKMVKRVEDLIQESAALKPRIVPQLQTLVNIVPELVNFGISIAQQLIPYLGDVRSAKSAFQLDTLLGFVKQVASSTVGKGKDCSSWQSATDFITEVMADANKLLPVAMEAENVVKITGTAPWVLRIDEIKAATAINVEAERKVTQLNEEIQGLIRTLRSKDQHIQEAVVKIELMDRRMESVKKQADHVTELEAELSKAHKQERAYEEAMEQLQADLDTFEQENARLKAAASTAETQPTGAQPVEQEAVPVEGSLETSYLLEQIDALRGTVRFLRTENSFLKGQDLLKEIESLPALHEPFSRLPTPPLVASGASDSSDSDLDDSPSPPSLRTLAAESKLLFRDVIKYTASPRVVDLSVRKKKRAEGEDGEEKASMGTKAWLPKKKTPAYQVWERKQEGERLGRRVQALLERTNSL